MREIGIGLLGLGTVGSGVIEIIRRREDVWMERYGFRPVVKKILVRDAVRARKVEVDAGLLTTTPEDLIRDPEIEILIEVLGGEEPARHIAHQALQAGKHLVTANKLLLALHGPELYALAAHNGVEIGFEGSVGGGIPIIQPLRESLNANYIHSLLGIINGTTNYILTAMAKDKASYYDVLESAQALGYAEADPASDVDGWDACYKLSILTGVAFGAQLPVTAIPTCGISAISPGDLELARDLGYVIKLVASAQRTANGSTTGRVHPTLLPAGHPLANVQGVNNALLVTGDAVGEVLFYGPGAGMLPTGSAVVSDLIRICRRLATAEEPNRYTNPVPVFVTGTGQVEPEQFLITIQSSIRPDAGQIALKLAGLNIPVQSIYSKDTNNLYTVGILTGPAVEQEITRVIENLSTDSHFRKIFYFYIERG